MLRIVAQRLDDTKAFCSALAKEHAVTNREELRARDETEGYQRAVTSPNEGTVNVDDRAGLADGADVEHSLVARADSGSVRQDKH